MKDLVEHIAKSLVTQPDEVNVVVASEDGKMVNLELRTAPDDMGKVIGKQGKIAKALRTLVSASTPRDSKRYIVEIKEKA